MDVPTCRPGNFGHVSVMSATDKLYLALKGASKSASRVPPVLLAKELPWKPFAHRYRLRQAEGSIVVDKYSVKLLGNK